MESTLQYLKSTEAYEASSLNCHAFRRSYDEVNGKSISLGNMVSGFPFIIEGVEFYNSEAAYIAGAFSDASPLHLSIQNDLRQERNGFMAKKRIRRVNEEIKRRDWEDFNIMWMLYVVWCKCVGNETFRNLLMSLPHDAVIIENSTFQKGRTATFWGTKNEKQYSLHKSLCKILKNEGLSKNQRNKILDGYRLNQWNKEGIYVGCNCMGKILMLCRDALNNGSLPPIDFSMLRERSINFFGHILTFDMEGQLPLRA